VPIVRDALWTAVARTRMLASSGHEADSAFAPCFRVFTYVFIYVKLEVL